MPLAPLLTMVRDFGQPLPFMQCLYWANDHANTIAILISSLASTLLIFAWSPYWRALGLEIPIRVLSPEEPFHLHANFHAIELFWSLRLSSKCNGFVLRKRLRTQDMHHKF